jgi:uncharacterized membrane protein YebE (DUF533 family)
MSSQLTQPTTVRTGDGKVPSSLLNNNDILLATGAAASEAAATPSQGIRWLLWPAIIIGLVGLGYFGYRYYRSRSSSSSATSSAAETTAPSNNTVATPTQSNNNLSAQLSNLQLRVVESEATIAKLRKKNQSLKDQLCSDAGLCKIPTKSSGRNVTVTED